MTRAVLTTQETALQDALFRFSDTIASSGDQVTPDAVKAAILDVCIDLRTPVEQLPGPLQELYSEATRRLRAVETLNFNADALQRNILTLTAARRVLQ
jgi:hypothetical protein